jgi:nucleoid DNA-binding protein
MAARKNSRQADTAEVARLVRGCLLEGTTVEIEGLGRFSRKRSGKWNFQPETRSQVFIAYAAEDRFKASRLYRALHKAGYDPWMDCEKLLPGQNWPRAIERAIATSEYFIACLSKCSVIKRGMFQAELRFALDCSRHQPLGEIFLIPLRLDQCKVPPEIQQEIQYIDLFPNWEKGMTRIKGVMDEARKRPKAA